jgi:protein-tyrosine phosphatase
MAESSQQPRKYSVLFVCLGNICRSPAAEGVMTKLVADRNLSDVVHVDSAGTSNYHSGQLADPRMRAAAAKRGYDLTSKARSFERQDLHRFDLIIAMDRENYRQVHCFASDDAKNVYLMSEFLDPKWPRDVPDPYYGTEDGFEFVLDMIEAACPRILNSLAPDQESSPK